jgi:hypothetical protein
VVKIEHDRRAGHIERGNIAFDREWLYLGANHLGSIGKQFKNDHAQRLTYRSRALFGDPDGNGWQLQEVTNRLPGRVEPGTTSFRSASDLASALRRAEAAHSEHEKRIGQLDANWTDWYAVYMLAEQSGEELSQ